MSNRRLIFAAGAALLASSAALAQSTAGLEERLAELEARDAESRAVISDLQSKVRELQGDDRMNEARAEEIRALVQDVLADADTRSSLLQSGATAGWDNGFFIGSADGSFRLGISGQMQLTYIYSMQNDSPEDDNRAGFEHTRIRFGFAGHVIDPTWQYFLWAGWNSSGTSLILDAWVRKSLDNGWSFQAGQMKTEAWREWTVAEKTMQFAERSLIDARYGVSWTQGVAAQYKNDDVRLNLQVNDGIRTRATAWDIAPDQYNGIYELANEYAVGARGEWKLSGEWSDYGDWEGWRGGEGLVILGASIYAQQGEYGTPDPETNIVQYSVDATVKWNGASLFAAVLGTSIDDDVSQDRMEMAALVQGGYFLAEDLELIGRYEWGDLDGGGGPAGDDLSLVTIGLTKFWNRHGLKWTTDLGYSFDPVDAAWNGSGRGWRTDAPGEDGQVVLRTQLNLLF